MGFALERAGALWMDAVIAAFLWTSLCALVMVGCSQPVRRVTIARFALAGALVILPIVGTWRGPRLDLVAVFGRLISGRSGGGAWWVPGDLAESRAGSTGWRQARQWVAATEALGTSLGSAWIVLGWWAGCRMVAAARQPGGETLARYRALEGPGDPRRPPLRVSSRMNRPVLVGAFRPVILIPERLDGPDGQEDLPLALLHELAHVRRHDPAHGLMAAAAQAVWFALPPAWWIRTQMRLDQEFLADAAASSALGPCSTRYASALVGLAGGRAVVPPPGGFPSSLAPAGPGHPVSSLFLRVLVLLRRPFPIERRAPGWYWLLAPPALLVLLLLCGLTVRPQSVPPEELTPESRSVSIAYLRLSPPPPTEPDGVARFPLPIPRPRSFDFSCEILASADDLTRTRFGGYQIGPLEAEPRRDNRWRTLRIHNTGTTARAWVDGHPVPVSPVGSHNANWTIAGSIRGDLVLRNLGITW